MRAIPGDIVVLGAGGKMGPTLAIRAKRAVPEKRVIAVSRFSSATAGKVLRDAEVETVSADLFDRSAKLPDAENVIYMAGRKFGSAGAESLTWAMNAYLPAMVCERYKQSRIVAFSSGNIYPVLPVTSGGATEKTPVGPTGEYAQSVLARERIFEYFSSEHGLPVLLIRLNYAVDLRYGVLLDIGTKVFQREPVEVAMGAVNVIWQGDANSVSLRSLQLCASPAALLNLTGPETLSVRQIALRFGEHFGVTPAFTGTEGTNALLNYAARCFGLFVYPSVTVEQIIEWT
ncbi:MAG: NAD-dependent epimerase/dehydratase family protein, partial [Bryobacteraceae bacterium]